MDDSTPDVTQLRRLVGRWSGRGRSFFPTIDSFRYDEETTFYWNGVEPMLQLKQRTWSLGDAGTRIEPLHWEAGFFRALENDEIEVVSAQNGERVEVFRGTLEASDAKWTLHFDSSLLGNDERMVRTRHVYELSKETLTYRVWMATTKVAALTQHLEAELRRVATEPE